MVGQMRDTNTIFEEEEVFAGIMIVLHLFQRERVVIRHTYVCSYMLYVTRVVLARVKVEDECECVKRQKTRMNFRASPDTVSLIVIPIEKVYDSNVFTARNTCTVIPRYKTKPDFGLLLVL